MMPIDAVQNEHELIIKMLSVTGAICSLIDEGREVSPDHITAITDFIRNFVNAYHHQKEEKVLFPALIDTGIPLAEGHIEAMMRDHDLGKTYARAIEAAFSLYRNGKRQSLEEFSRYANNYKMHYTSHILKENNLIYAFADFNLTLDQKKQVRKELELFEQLESSRDVSANNRLIVNELHSRYLSREE